MSPTETATADNDGLKPKSGNTLIEAPALSYQPREPKSYRPHIALIGCGGITAAHLGAYRDAGYNVVALCDQIEANAEKRRAEFFPDAKVYTDAQDVLSRSDIEVIDIATHPAERVPLVRKALQARKHVLSQKPFVLDLDTGQELADLADQNGVRLAVNQNGRWAPHFSYLREAVRAGVIGDVLCLHAHLSWDHGWVIGTPFENIYDVVFYDFAIHWFDFAATIFAAAGRRATRVQANRAYATGQKAKPPLLAQTLIEFEGGQASLIFDAAVPFGAQDNTYIGGTQGTLSSSGPTLDQQTVVLHTAAGSAQPLLSGQWFNDGFRGTMGELLCAIEEDREPMNSARNNLDSLALCFAVIEAAGSGQAHVPGTVRRLPQGSAPTAPSSAAKAVE